MKYLLTFLVLFSSVAFADFGAFDVGFGQGTKTFYGGDYEFLFYRSHTYTLYLDASLFANHDYIQPGLSGGLQFEHLNVGFASAYNSKTNWAVGPEFGLMQDLPLDTYIKINNSFMGLPSTGFNYGLTLSFGVNF